jgi:hypothetical protein
MGQARMKVSPALRRPKHGIPAELSPRADCFENRPFIGFSVFRAEKARIRRTGPDCLYALTFVSPWLVV